MITSICSGGKTYVGLTAQASRNVHDAAVESAGCFRRSIYVLVGIALINFDV